MKRYGFATLLFVSMLHSVVFAEAIVFTHQGVGSGTLDGNAFSDVEFSITATADTDNIAGDFVKNIVHESASIELVGLGTFELEFPSRTFFHPGVPIVGFQPGIAWPGGSADLFNGPETDALSGWDMKGSIGPVSAENGRLLQWNGNGNLVGQVEFPTSGGVLYFNDADNVPSTFTATVPEPNSLPMLTLALTMFLVARRGKR